MTNLLTNPGFEGGWVDLPPVGTLTNQCPVGYTLNIRPTGATLLSAGYGPDDNPIYEKVAVIPECVHKNANQLPADEGPGGEDALILDGVWTYKIFAAGGAFSADLTVRTVVLAAGVVSIAVPTQVHAHGDPSPGAAVWRLVVNGTPTPWVSFKNGFEDRAWHTERVSLHAEAGDELTVVWQPESRALGGIDFFTDAWEITLTPDAEEEPEQRGKPRGEYARTYWLLPQAATQAQVQRALALAYPSRGTVGFSADDAGIGDLDSREVRVLWFAATDWDRGKLDAFFAEWYPGVTIIHVFVDIPPVVSPVGGEPTPYAPRSNNLIGLHSGYVGEESMNYLVQARPTVQKWFSAGDCYRAKQQAPDCLMVWRKYVGNEAGRIYEHSTIREAAVWYVNQYAAELETAARNMGITVADLLTGIDFVESLNETIPTNNIPVLKDAVEFDVCFAEELYSRYGDSVHPLLLNGAVGNPDTDEVEYLLPAVRAAVKYNGALGLHTYWAANGTSSFLESGWEWHAGRALLGWDPVFRANGLYPLYLSTETGICFAPDGWSFQSSRGWKSCGSFEKYLADIAKYNTLCLAWNAEHANRFLGGTLFCSSQWEWEDFLLGTGEVKLLIEWSKTL